MTTLEGVLPELSQSDRTLLCSALNTYGPESGVFACPSTLPYFKERFVIDTLSKAIKDSEGCDMGSVIDMVNQAKRIRAKLLRTQA